MPIHVISGLPGHGKTAEMMVMLIDAAKKAKRPIFAAGIDGLEPGLATVLPDPTRWNDEDPNAPATCDCHQDGRKHGHYVPDGALIFVDEAWKWFGHLQNASRQQTPPHVLALAEHRHRGIDFVWTTQAPAQLFPFARSMIEQHWHVVRKFGTSLRDVYKWGELQDEVKSEGVRARAEKTIKPLPKQVFGRYKSASEHTIKARIPGKVLLLPVLALFAAFCVWSVYRYFVPEAQATEAAADGLPAAPAAGLTPAVERGTRPDDLSAYMARLVPRAPGLHGSQPVFDERPVLAVPRTFCVMSGDPREVQRCTCYTEQVTPIFSVPDDVCRHVARWGEYDPFRGPLDGGNDGDLGDTAGALPELKTDGVRPAGPVGA